MSLTRAAAAPLALGRARRRRRPGVSRVPRGAQDGHGRRQRRGSRKGAGRRPRGARRRGDRRGTGDIGVYLTGLGTVTALQHRHRAEPRRRPAHERVASRKARSSTRATCSPRSIRAPSRSSSRRPKGQTRQGPGARSRTRKLDLRALPDARRAGRDPAAAARHAGRDGRPVRGRASRATRAQIDSAKLNLDLQPHHRADHRARSACGWSMPATSCTPPTRTASLVITQLQPIAVALHDPRGPACRRCWRRCAPASRFAVEAYDRDLKTQARDRARC